MDLKEVKETPLDYNKWNKLIKQAIVKGKPDIKNILTNYLSIFKYDGFGWITLINYEIQQNNNKEVTQLFGQCITKIDNVELFRLYVNYVKSTNDIITGGENARNIVLQAYKFSVDKVGIDIDSKNLWDDYILFINSWTPTTNFEINQKNELIRQVYKEALSIPINSIEKIWGGFTKFEQDLGSLANKNISDKSSDFMELRSWINEWKNKFKGIKRPINPGTIEDDDVKIQVNLWKEWIEFEAANKLNLPEPELQKRIEYVYRQSTFTLPFVPEIYYNYIGYLKSQDRSDSEIMELSIKLNPKSYLLNFEVSEFFEKDHTDKSNKILNDLIEAHTKDYDVIVNKIAELEEKYQKQKAEKIVPSLSTDEIQRLNELQTQHKTLSRDITLVYTKLMMLNKRTKGLKESREVFKTAKKFNHTHELYVENALIEYYSDKTSTAKKVFELGMKAFGSHGPYLISYLDFLITINETESIKVLFETAMTNMTTLVEENKVIIDDLDIPEWIKLQKQQEIKSTNNHIKELMKIYGKFSTKFLDFDIISNLESRWRTLFPNDDIIEFSSYRYSYDDIDLINYDLGKDPHVHKTVEEHQDKKRKLPTKPQVQQKVAVEEDEGPEFVGKSIYKLLNFLPNANYFNPSYFNNKKLIELFNSLQVPEQTESQDPFE